MTAQLTASWDHHRWTPDDARQRLANYTVEDVLALPDDAPRVELDNGVLVVVPSPANGHQKIGHRLWRWFDDNAPDDLEAIGAVGWRSTSGTHWSPTSSSCGGRWWTRITSMTPSRSHYWRIEQDPVHIYAYELDEAGSYQLVADSDTELVL